MSCQMKSFASLVDVDSVKRYLFSQDCQTDSAGDSWDWPDEEIKKSNENDQNWLQECNVSLSSTGELLVITRKNVMVILTSKWDSQEEGEVKNKYHITGHGCPCQDNEQITAVLCVPLVSQGKSSHLGPDWTCVVLGFSSGIVRFYTETCSPLLSEPLHNEPVTAIKCQSYQPARFTGAQEHAEELYILYKSVVCVIPGFGIFQTLRACRNQLARLQANCGDVVHAPPLAFKKWGFQDQEVVADCTMVGPTTANTFDHLLTASLCGGFNTWYRSSAPQNSLLIATGCKPFVGFHFALEGEAPPVLTDVAKAMANKLKSTIGQAIPGWLLGGGKKVNHAEKAKEKVPLEPAEALACRFGLCDLLRHGHKIAMSPNKNLSVVSDSLGRVILIDDHKGLAVRMWKGYRDAQCGWLEVQEECRHRSNRENHARTALFVVIYSPKKGIIEIWGMQQGPKIATFKASKSGRLLYTSHGLMGMNNVPLKGGNKPLLPCSFLDPSGLISELVVPFHFALSNKNSKRARDLHLLKQLKAFMRKEEYSNERLVEEVGKAFRELKTHEVQMQALEMLCSSRHVIPHALDAALAACLDKLSITDTESLDHVGRSLVAACHQLQHLVAFYQFVHCQYQQPPTYRSVVNQQTASPQEIAGQLHAPEKEVTSLLHLVATIERLSDSRIRLEPRVAFQEDGQSLFVDFLSCFDIGGSGTVSSTTTGQEIQQVVLRKNVPEDKLKRVGELVYQGALYSDNHVEEWRLAAMGSGIQPSQLLHLGLHFWLGRRLGSALVTEMTRFMHLLHAVCSLADVDDVCPNNNEVSEWWREVRAVLAESCYPFMALTAAIVCQGVAVLLEKEKEKQAMELSADGLPPQQLLQQQQQQGATSPDEDTRSSTSEWENVSRDTCQWSTLIGQLEDVSLVDTVVRQKPSIIGVNLNQKFSNTHLYVLPFEKPSISLNYVLTKGKGSVSELVARWLRCVGLDPSRLVALSDVEFDGSENIPVPESRPSLGVTEGRALETEVGAEAAVDSHASVLEPLAALRAHFPYSLTSSVLLANLSWEYLLAWQHAGNGPETLWAAVHCLRVLPSAHLRHGVCGLAWAMHLRQRFEAAARQLHRVGRAPRESVELPGLVAATTTFLDTFLEARVLGESEAAPTVRSEDLWGGQGPPPLAELALAQPLVNYDLLHLHYQLSLALNMLTTFSFRFPKLLTSLFDSVGQVALFSDLTSQPQLPGSYPGPDHINHRTQFLTRVISEAVQTIRPAGDAGMDTAMAVEWVGKCYELAAVWHVSSDTLRRHHICELYSNGYDRLAEEVLPAASNTVLLGSQLLLIVGQRVKHVINSSTDICDKKTLLTTDLSRWLDGLSENGLKNYECPLSDTAQVLERVMQYLPEHLPEYRLALHLVEAVHCLLDASNGNTDS